MNLSFFWSQSSDELKPTCSLSLTSFLHVALSDTGSQNIVMQHLKIHNFMTSCRICLLRHTVFIYTVLQKKPNYTESNSSTDNQTIACSISI